MSEGVELATAWVRLVPSAEGITDSLVEAFAPGTKAAQDEGEKAGAGWASKVKGAIGVAAIGAGVVAAFKGLYEVGDIFDAVADTIRVGTGATGEALDGLVDSATNVGLRVPAEFEKIGPAVADINTRMGLTGDTLETVASQYLEAGRILETEVDIGKTSAAFNAFKIEGDGVIDAMDTLFQVSQATGVGMNELAAGVQVAAPALQNLGFGFEESVALLGSLDKAGLNSTAVMASMSKGLVTLAKDGEEPQEAFRRVTSELQGFVDEGNTAAALDLASQVFGTRGAAQFVGALQSGVLNMTDLMAATGATGDTILGVGEETMDFAERWQLTMNTALVALEPLATAVFSAVGDGLTSALPLLQDLGAWVGENVEVIGVIAGVIGVTLVAAFVAWTASIWAATAALLANPITWIIVGIVALIAAIVALVMNWDQVVAFILDIWAGFIGWLTDGINAFVEWWNGIWATVGAAFRLAWDALTAWVRGIWAGFVTWLVGIVMDLQRKWDAVWMAVRMTIDVVWNAILGVLRAAVDYIVGGFVAAWSMLTGFFSDLWNGIVTGITVKWNEAITFLRSIPDLVRGFFAGIGTWLVQSGRDLIQGFVDGIGDMIGAVGDAVGGVLDFARGFFPSSPAKRGPFSGAGWIQLLTSGEAIGEQWAAGVLASRSTIAAALAATLAYDPSITGMAGTAGALMLRSVATPAEIDYEKFADLTGDRVGDKVSRGITLGSRKTAARGAGSVYEGRPR
ncbi:phage tail tape measure protein [Microbacterium sp. No. 7]|uniref:phage tail tape measure protein n=1 Tax=Microbacterium sp. No. 7 TaxID=1714373 RepID=UPI0006D0CA48|nr:phage tail tape measure protein [Microbacterium sp. No. 7]ALJ20375.1 hypothetical protein AOA12_10820 [Microbacterium sp. No. 7]